MAVQKQGSQLETTYSSSVRIRGVAQGMNNRDGWAESVRDICADGVTR